MGACWATYQEGKKALRSHSWERERGTQSSAVRWARCGAQGGRSGELVPGKGIGRQRSLQPHQDCGGPEASDSVLQPLHHCPSGLSCCPSRSAAGEPQLPRLPPTRVFSAHLGWEEASRNPLCSTPSPGTRHQSPQPISAIRKTSTEQPPPFNPSSFRRKSFRAGAPWSASLPNRRRSLPRSPSQHPTTRAPPSTYSPGPC